MKRANKKRRGRPLKGDKKRIRTSFTLPPEQITWLEKEAKKLNSTKSEFLSKIISEEHYCRSEISTLLKSRFNISQKVLTRLCQRYHISKLSLYGSILTNNFSPNSDIDILVEFESEHEPSYFTIVRMEQDLSRLLNNRKVDIRTPDDLSRYFRKDVLNSAEVLYAA